MTNQLNQKEIVNRIAEKTGFTKKDINEMLSAFSEIVYDVVKDDGNLFFKNVFTIKTKNVKAQKKYIAPLHDYIYQEAHKTVKIVPSKNLIKAVKEE